MTTSEPVEEIYRPDGAVGDILKSADISRAANLTVNAPSPKAKKMRRYLRNAARHLEDNQFHDAAALAIKALDLDPEDGLGNHICAIAMDRLERRDLALKMYSRAVRNDPSNPEIYRNLGLLTWRMQRYEAAEKFFRLQAEVDPDGWEALNNLACVLRDQEKIEDSMELAKAAAFRFPEIGEIWSTLGSTVLRQKKSPEAKEFYKEALRLCPTGAEHYHNLAYLEMHDGDLDVALDLFEQAQKVGFKTNRFLFASQHAHALATLAAGQLEKGWKSYRIRYASDLVEYMIYDMKIPRWNYSDLKGKRLLLVGEQGLGDEVLFMSVINDVIKAIGPEGKLGLVVEKRLKDLVARSFPEAEVYTYSTALGIRHGVEMTIRYVNEIPGGIGFDCYALMASPMELFRNKIEDFQQPADGYFTPDPDRVEHWRNELAKLPPGKKVGVLWKSGLMNSNRARWFNEFMNWKKLIKTDGVTWINLQYGDAEEDIKLAKDKFGVEIHQLPGIDLKKDLDDLCALTKALDLMIGPMNATTNIGGAAGVPFWLIWPKNAWTQLSTGTMPWYPDTRLFAPDDVRDWSGAIDAAADALAEYVAEDKADAA